MNTFFPGKDFDEVFEEASKTKPGSDGLLFYPYLLGERAPLWSSSVRGGFSGLDIQHTLPHFARSVMEGILFNLYSIGKVLLEMQKIDTIYANGGFAKSPFWVQMLSDIFGKKVNTLVLPEVGQDGFESYHHDAPWGQDILKSGRTIGIGSYGRYDEQNDFVETFKTVKSTSVKVANDKTSSYAAIDYTGWKTWGDAVDLKSKLTIYNKDRFVKVDLALNNAISGLCTGIVAIKDIPFKQVISKNKKWAYIATYGQQTLAKKEDNLGMAIFYPVENFDKYVQTKSTYIVVFKKNKNVSYYFLGAWSQEPNGIKTETEFYKDLDKKLETLEQNNQL